MVLVVMSPEILGRYHHHPLNPNTHPILLENRVPNQEVLLPPKSTGTVNQHLGGYTLPNHVPVTSINFADLQLELLTPEQIASMLTAAYIGDDLIPPTLDLTPPIYPNEPEPPSGYY